MKQVAFLRQMAVFGNNLRPLKYYKNPLESDTERRYTIHAFTNGDSLVLRAHRPEG
jgi:hypothetical protein